MVPALGGVGCFGLGGRFYGFTKAQVKINRMEWRNGILLTRMDHSWQDLIQRCKQLKKKIQIQWKIVEVINDDHKINLGKNLSSTVSSLNKRM